MQNSSRDYHTITISLLLFVLLGTTIFPSSGRDDDYIAFWVADSLRSHGEIINYNGERIEQGSSPGHILTLTLVSIITKMPAPRIAVPVSVIAGICLLFVMGRFRSHFDRQTIQIALFLTATSFPFIYWSYSGLETGLYTLTLSIFCLVVANATANNGNKNGYQYLFAIILALQLLRPEAFFVLGLLFGLLWILRILRELSSNKEFEFSFNSLIHSKITSYIAIAILLNILAFVILATFRYLYFGDFFPQPVASKLTGIFPGLHSGVPIIPGGRYIARFFTQNPLMICAILSGLIIVFKDIHSGREKQSVLLNSSSVDILIVVAAAQFTFIFLAGPDWMEGFRFIVPIVPVLSLLSALFLSRLCRQFSFKLIWIIVIVATIQVAGLMRFAQSESSSAPLWTVNNNILDTIPGAASYSWFARMNTRHLRDIPLSEALKKTIGKLKLSVPDRPIVISSFQAGLVMYHVTREHFGDIYFVDIAGLADRTITQCPPLKERTRELRTAAAMSQGLGHLEVSKMMIEKANTAETCFTPRPDIIYMLGEDREYSQQFTDLGYTLLLSNTGQISLDYGNAEFYGGYLIDNQLLEKSGLSPETIVNFVEYR